MTERQKAKGVSENWSNGVVECWNFGFWIADFGLMKSRIQKSGVRSQKIRNRKRDLECWSSGGLE
jgi:hypothetical protein